MTIADLELLAVPDLHPIALAIYSTHKLWGEGTPIRLVEYNSRRASWSQGIAQNVHRFLFEATADTH